MIVSMTGFGRAEGTYGKKMYSIEIRTVNNRFCEISFKYPRYLATKDFELKEIVRKKISRGKISINLNVEADDNEIVNLNVDEKLIKEYIVLLKKVNGLIGSKEEIKIEHLLNFTDLFSADKAGEISEEEYSFVCKLLNKALDDLIKMKIKEGDSLKKDVLDRIKFIDKESAAISKLSKARVETERKRLLKRVELLLSDKRILDENRLEIEVILLSDKIDITEEVIRLKSHTKYFIEYTKSEELAGRRLNFLIQEINREINTIASKSLDAEISQRAAVMKEELEKIREQLQNVE
ncbi:MAG: YicC family protein [Ignavibacteria bacterium]|nr:YicC family protein [Ignavibacteria bacterium]